MVLRPRFRLMIGVRTQEDTEGKAGAGSKGPTAERAFKCVGDSNHSILEQGDKVTRSARIMVERCYAAL